MTIKSFNFRDDSVDESSQERTAALRILDMMVTECYNRNKIKSNDPEYRPRLVIYIGHLEYYAMMSCSFPPGANVAEDTYRGFPVHRVTEGTHCRVFCTNPPKA